MYRLVFAAVVGLSCIGFNSAEAATLGSLLGLDEALGSLDLDSGAAARVITNTTDSSSSASNGSGGGATTMSSGSCCSPQVSCCSGGGNGGGNNNGGGGGNAGSGGTTIINIDIDITINNFYGSFCQDVASACGCN